MEVDTVPVVTAALVAGLIAGYGIAIPVGAVATYLVALTARTSIKVGTCAALGIATADGVYALVATFGGVALAPLIASIADPLRWTAAAVLTLLAIRGAITAIRRYRTSTTSTPDGIETRPAKVYFGFLAITMLNPTTVIYFAALVLGRQTSTTPLEQAAFVFAAFAASASWQLLLAAGGSLLGRLLTGPRGQLTTALVSTTVITALAIHLITSP